MTRIARESVVLSLNACREADWSQWGGMAFPRSSQDMLVAEIACCGGMSQVASLSVLHGEYNVWQTERSVEAHMTNRPTITEKGGLAWQRRTG